MSTYDLISLAAILTGALFLVILGVRKYVLPSLSNWKSKISNINFWSYTNIFVSVLLLISTACTLVGGSLTKLAEFEAGKAEKIIKLFPTQTVRSFLRDFTGEDGFISGYFSSVVANFAAVAISWLIFAIYKKALDSSKTNLSKAQKEPKVDIDYLLKSELIFMKESLNITTDIRITLFRDEGIEKKFSCFARFSDDPEYQDKHGYFYDKIGLISLAYSNSKPISHFGIADPRVDEDGYVKFQCEKLKLTEVRAKDIRMRSRCYIAEAIYDTKKQSKIGVIIFESLDPDGLSKNTVARIKSLGLLKKLSVVMEIVEVLRPKMSVHKGEKI
ncbi:hypothetical protein [Pseudomonas carnis]|uniref:hypothetical protein n=1 Tax=Pseudomonas carnis TaxID=2487355 RepID=UPI001BC93B8B|nr:hypothetical protein [Pseudomonas carnis]